MDAKAEKLAQARRKLREYQSKHQNRAAFTNDGGNWSSSPHQANSTGRRSVSSIQSGMTSSGAMGAGSGFVHDDHKSPFERVRSQSQCSQAVYTSSDISVTVDTTEQENIDGNGMESGQHSGNTLTHGQEQGNGRQCEVDGYRAVACANDALENGQLGKVDGGVGNGSGGNSCAAGAQDQNLNGDINSMITVGIEKRDGNLVTKEEYDRVVEALQRADYEKNTLAGQLGELHGHYADIYAAYTKLSESIGSDEGVVSGNSAMAIQLNHLKTAMSVLVKEKTEMQHQLREAHETGEMRERHIQSIQSELADRNERLMRAEAEMGAARHEMEKLNAMVRREGDELERCRRECREWQAKAWHIQQDSNDAQERLKLCIRESEAAQAELQEAKRQLHLKEIYMRQMGAVGGAVVSEGDIGQMQAENERLKSELVRRECEREQMREEARVAKEHYEAYGTQLNQNVLQISAQLESVSAERLELKSKVEALEDELDVIRGEQRKRDELRKPNEKESIFETIHLRQQLGEAEEMRGKVETRVVELERELEGRDADMGVLRGTIKDLESELNAKSESLKAVESALEKERREREHKIHFNEDVRSLTEQLQNEKATVSRAVTQNLELKEQLIELQNKLVTLSEESMERESGRLSALYQVEQLQTELERLKWHQIEDGGEEGDGKTVVEGAGTKGVGRADESGEGDQPGFDGSQKDGGNGDGETAMTRDQPSAEVEKGVSSSRTQDERAEWDRELKQVKEQLDEVKGKYNEMRLDYRRVTQENEELRRIMEQNAEDENQNSIRVELGQAVARINALSQENADLRDQMADLDQQRTKDRLDSESKEAEVVQKWVEADKLGKSNGSESSSQVDDRGRAVSSDIHGEGGLEEGRSGERRERYEELGKDIVNEVNEGGNAVVGDGSGGGEGECVHEMPSIAEKPLAWTELEARFARAMRQNADLMEQNERLEHVILQLQCENDTIGEYVTIYQHQRKIIRERMHEKEEAVARLSLEKEHVQEKLSELQQTLMNVLTKKGILQSYDRERARRKKRDVNGAIVRRANKLRSFSHSTVDEFSGDEETVVDGRAQVIPETAEGALGTDVTTAVATATVSESNSDGTIQDKPAESCSGADLQNVGQPGARVDLETGSINDTGRGTSEQRVHLNEVTNEGGLVEMAQRIGDNVDEDDDVDEDLGVQRILNLITELQNTEQGRLLPPCDPKMHCRECRGKLITL